MDFSNFNIWLGGGEHNKVLVQVLTSDWVYRMKEPLEVSCDRDEVFALADIFFKKSLDPQDTQRLGTALYDMLLPIGMIRDLYQDSRVLALHQGKGIRIRLHIASTELNDLPWELLFGREEGGFLSLNPRFSIARTPLLVGAKLPMRPIVNAFPLRIVGAFPVPEDLPAIDTAGEQAAIDKAIKMFKTFNVKQEQKATTEALEQLPPDVQVKSMWLPGATLDDLLEHLPDAHVFHFGGHAGQSRDKKDDEPAFLILEDKERRSYFLPASTLALILRRSLVRVAVFVSCDTAKLSPRSGGSLPQMLIEAGLSAVVAMQALVFDNITGKFGRYFYEALAAGLRIDEALSAARYITRVSFPDLSSEWAVPVLYMASSSDGLIFPERTAALELEAARQRQPIIYNIVQNIGTVTGGQVTGLSGEATEPINQGVSASNPVSQKSTYRDDLSSIEKPSSPAF